MIVGDTKGKIMAIKVVKQRNSRAVKTTENLKNKMIGNYLKENKHDVIGKTDR